MKGEDKREDGGNSTVSSHPNVRNPEKYPDYRTDLIGGEAT